MSVQTQQLREIIWPLLRPDSGWLPVEKVSWAVLERAPGEYDFSGLHALVERSKSIKRCVILHITPDVPPFCKSHLEDFLRLLEACGNEIGIEPTVLGVDLCCPDGEDTLERESLLKLICAYQEAFPSARLFVPIGSRAEALISKGKGLIISSQSVLCTSEAWKGFPIRMALTPGDKKAEAFAAGNHVSILESLTGVGTNEPTQLGYRYILRKLAVDDTRKDDGVLKVTLWLANTGSVPCYQRATFKLRLRGSGVSDLREYELPLLAEDIGPSSEKKLETMVGVTGLKTGEYELHVGLFMKDTDYPIPFGIEGRISDGYYEGRIIIEI